jgi:hypothetical protein
MTMNGYHLVHGYAANHAGMPFHRLGLRTEVDKGHLVTQAEQANLTASVTDDEDGAPVAGVPVAIHWAYPSNQSKIGTWTTGASGSVSDTLNSIIYSGTGYVQATGPASCDRQHELSWHSLAWYTDLSQVWAEAQVMKGRFSGQFGYGKAGVTIDPGNKKFIFSWGKKP